MTALGIEMREDQPLTAREREVCELVAQGMTSKEIGRRLGISHRTVECHRASILAKKGVRRAVDLVRYVFAMAST